MTDSLLPGPEVITRARAKELGLKRYFTGKPCLHGHMSERRVIGAACVTCCALRRDPAENYARVKAWRAENPEKITEEARKYREKYPDKVAANSKRWREKHIDRLRPIEADKTRKRRKQDPEGYRCRLNAYKERQEQKLTRVAGRPRPQICEVCSETSKTVYDHCHNSGMFRGWICDRCNKTLGMVKDSPMLLKKLAKYLEDNYVELDGQRAKISSEQGFFWSASLLSN